MSNTCGQYKAVDGTDKRRKTRQFHFLMRSLIQLLSQNLSTTMVMSHIQVIHFVNQNTSSTYFPILTQAMWYHLRQTRPYTKRHKLCSVQKIPILCVCGNLQLKLNPLLVDTCTICHLLSSNTSLEQVTTPYDASCVPKIPILCGCSNLLHQYLSPACTLKL